MKLDHFPEEPVTHLLVEVKDGGVGAVVAGSHQLGAEVDRLSDRLIFQRARDTAAADRPRIRVGRPGRDSLPPMRSRWLPAGAAWLFCMWITEQAA